MTSPDKKRTRLSLSCNLCKRRKVKCDRGRPCKACQKHNVPEQCDYPDHVWELEKDGVQFSQPKPTVPAFAAKPPPLQAVPAMPPTSVMYSELENLKSKIKHFEQFIGSAASPNSTVTQELTIETASEPVKLPPLINSHAPSVPESDTYVGINPYDPTKPNHLVDFYYGYCPIFYQDESRQMNHGPFSWLSFIKKDKSMTRVWNRLNKPKATAAVLRLATTPGKTEGESNYEEEFREKALDREGFDDIKPYDKRASRLNKTRAIRTQMNKNAIALGLTMFEGKIDQELQLLEKIHMILPKRRVVWTLVRIFFSVIYPFVPFFNENEFREQLVKILGPESYEEEPVEMFRIEKRLDFATIAAFLIILRMAYLSNFSNKHQINKYILESDDPNYAEKRYLLSNPIDIDVINFAQLCLDQFDLTRKTNLQILVTAMMMRVYRMFSPEDGDGTDGGDAQTFNAMLTQMACTVGVNREPDNFKDALNDEKKNNLMRRLWFFLMVMDSSQAALYGLPLSIDEHNYDIKLPFWRAGNEIVNDHHLDRVVNENILDLASIYFELRKIITMALSLRTKQRMVDFTAAVSRFEVILHRNCGKLSDFTRTVPDPTVHLFLKIKKCKSYLAMKIFLLTIYHHFFLDYEQQGNVDLCFFYLRKVLSILWNEFMPEYLELIQNNHIHFDPHLTVSDFILNPGVQFMIHKGGQVLFAMILRLNTTIRNLKKNIEVHDKRLRGDFSYKLRFAKLCKLARIMEKLARFGVDCLSQLSGRYYYAWRVSKAHRYIIDLIVKESFYADDEDLKGCAGFPDFSDEQFSELLKMGELCLWKLKNVIEKEAALPQEEPAITPYPAYPESHLGSSVELDNFDHLHHQEIDRLWMQMVSMRDDDIFNVAQTTDTTDHIDSLFQELNGQGAYPVPITAAVLPIEIPSELWSRIPDNIFNL